MGQIVKVMVANSCASLQNNIKNIGESDFILHPVIIINQKLQVFGDGRAHRSSQEIHRG